jgi:hypothetical protein
MGEFKEFSLVGIGHGNRIKLGQPRKETSTSTFIGRFGPAEDRNGSGVSGTVTYGCLCSALSSESRARCTTTAAHTGQVVDELRHRLIVDIDAAELLTALIWSDVNVPHS